MQTKETSFVRKLISSIKDFEEYPQMASKPFNTVIKYLIKLMLVFTFIVTIVSIFEVSKDIQNGIEYFKTQIPDLSFTNNELKVDSEEKIRIEANNIVGLIIINTNDIAEEKIDSYIKEIENYSTGTVFLKDKMILNMGEGTIQYSYEKLADMYNIGNMTKQDMLKYFTGTNLAMLYIVIFVMSFIWLFIAYITSTLLDSLILGILGYITSLLLRLRIKFVVMFKIAMHALTLPIILNLCYILLQTLLGFEIKYFEIMYVAVAYIYIITAILMIKSDLIKRGQELTKIIEEEQKIREQLERQKEEQRQKEEEEKKEEKRKNKKGKDKKTNDKEDDLGAEPQTVTPSE